MGSLRADTGCLLDCGFDDQGTGTNGVVHT